MKSMRVLHLPESYLPWTTGGKEVYCHALARTLAEAGVENHVAIHQHPAEPEPLGLSRHEGIATHVLPPLPGYGSRRSSYTNEFDALPGFAALLDEVRPDVVHFHDHGGSASLSHLRAVQARGCRTVLTFHSPGQTCPQRELLRYGRIPCDGEVLLRRCTTCRLTVSGVPRPFSDAAALVEWPELDPWSGSAVQRVLTARLTTRLFRQSLREFIRLADSAVALADWSRDVLRRNGCPETKLRLIRTGVPAASAVSSRVRFPERKSLRVVCSGRCVRIKGFHVLVDAVKLLPADFPVQVNFLSPSWQDAYGESLRRRIEGDPRFAPPRFVPSADVSSVLAEMDVAVVPSLWLETGPLTVLEAFGAGLPVVGSRLGGIAELVRDGADGWLFSPGDAAELAACLRRLVENPTLLASCAANIRPPRTFRHVGADYLRLYQDLTENCAAAENTAASPP
jgi:glycosyltransferase involved in cell wall biosynthesis